MKTEKDERLVDRFVLFNIYVTFDYLQTFLDANRARVLSKTKATTTILVSVRYRISSMVGLKKANFLAKRQHTQQKLLFLVNTEIQ